MQRLMTTAPAGYQSFTVPDPPQELSSEGYEEGLKDSVQQRINKMKGRSMMCRAYDNWARKSQNIQNLATLERLIQRVDWYCNETKSVQGRVLPAAMIMRISMVDAIRTEFRFAPPFVAELLRHFDGDFLKNMECIKLVGAQNQQAPIGPADPRTNFEGAKMEYLHWKLRRVAHQIVNVLEEEFTYARCFFGDDVQKKFQELFPHGVMPPAIPGTGTTLSEILGISKMGISWSPEDSQMGSCLSCSPEGYIPLKGEEEQPPELPFRSIWEVPRLIELCDRLDIIALRNKLGTSTFDTNNTENKLLHCSEVNESQKLVIDYGYFREAEMQSVSSMRPMKPMVSDDVVPAVPPPQSVRFASPSQSFQSMPPPSGPPPSSYPPGPMSSMAPFPVSVSPGPPPFASMGPGSFVGTAQMYKSSPWKILTPQTEGSEERKSQVVLEVCVKEVKFLPTLIQTKIAIAYHANGEDEIPLPVLQFQLVGAVGPPVTITPESFSPPLRPGDDPRSREIAWTVFPNRGEPSGFGEISARNPIDFIQPFTLRCSMVGDSALVKELSFHIAVPERCRQEDWLQVQASIPVMSGFLPALREELKMYLHEVPRTLFFSTLPSFAMSLSQLRTVLLADIDSGTTMQSRLLAAFASGVFALASLSFNFLMAQRGRDLELFASNWTQHLQNFTAFQI